METNMITENSRIGGTRSGDMKKRVIMQTKVETRETTENARMTEIANRRSSIKAVNKTLGSETTAEMTEETIAGMTTEMTTVGAVVEVVIEGMTGEMITEGTCKETMIVGVEEVNEGRGEITEMTTSIAEKEAVISKEKIENATTRENIPTMKLKRNLSRNVMKAVEKMMRASSTTLVKMSLSGMTKNLLKTKSSMTTRMLAARLTTLMVLQVGSTTRFQESTMRWDRQLSLLKAHALS